MIGDRMVKGIFERKIEAKRVKWRTSQRLGREPATLQDCCGQPKPVWIVRDDK